MSYRYIGNKSRLAALILERIGELIPAGSTVADPMCGTGVIAEVLRRAGYRVIAADLMTYAVHHAVVRLQLAAAPSFSGTGLSGYAEVQRLLQELSPFDGWYVRECSPAGNPSSGDTPRKYFTHENAARIDAIDRQINSWNRSSALSREEVALLRHDLVLAANRVANIAGTYGHYRSSFSNGSLAPLSLLPADILWFHSTDHVVRQGRAEDLAASIYCDLCYLDPPYMKRQYAANYHLIETIARGDQPEAVGVSGLRPWRDQYSDFCSKRRIRDAFRRVIGEMNCPLFLVSYSEDGLLGRNELTDLLGEFGDVEMKLIPFQRFRSNQSSLGAVVNEYLFTLRKRTSASI